jgi:hypothetical protein
MNIVQSNVATSPSGVLQSSYNYMSEYDYAQVFEPDKVLSIHPKYGNGLITGFCTAIGSELDYASDVVIHGEQGRLNQISTDVTVVGDVFTCPVAHNLRVGEIVMISDGVIDRQADVIALGSLTEFTAANRAVGAFGFTGTVSLFAFSSDFAKGSTGFTTGKTWRPEFFKNYTHTIKEYFDVAESDMAHASWVNTPYGERWFNADMERTRISMQNKVELTQTFNERAADGSASAGQGKGGMIGIVPTVRTRGMVGNGYITTLDELDQITFLLKQQGSCTAYTIWVDQIQNNHFNKMLAAINAPFAGGANYGLFQNNKDLALFLDFHSFVRNGITFHLTPWKLLDDPTMLGGEKFINTSVACMFVPAGEKYVQEDGTTVPKSYVSIRSRVSGGVNRKMKTKIFGLFGTETREDKMQVEYICEQTNQVVGANEWLVVNR